MIESPIIQALFAERLHHVILNILTTRFQTVPPEITLGLRPIQDDKKLDELVNWAWQCPDLEAFNRRLTSITSPS